MRRSIMGLCLFSFFLLGHSGVFAQKIIDKNQINERIRDLRNRLKEYHSNIKKGPETAEIKFEKVIEELEGREDVAVTVLFHDSEGTESTGAAREKASKASPARTVDEIDVDVANAQTKRLEETKKRNELFAQLRAKVQQATRRSQKNAREIHSLVAQIPDNE